MNLFLKIRNLFLKIIKSKYLDCIYWLIKSDSKFYFYNFTLKFYFNNVNLIDFI